MRRPSLPLALACLPLIACLEAPPPAPRTDAGTDAGPPRFEVLAVRGEDLHGQAWPLDALPRTPRVVVELSAPPLTQDPPALVLLRGEPDEDVLDDVTRAPLRASTREREVPTAREVVARRVTLSPTRQPRGAPLVLVVAGWAASEEASVTAPRLVPLRVSDAPEAGTATLESWPADGTSGVSPGLAELWLHFDGPVADVAGVRLLGPEPIPAEVLVQPCDGLWADGSCVILRPLEALRASHPYAIEVGEDALDPTGAPIGPWRSRFSTGASADRNPPSLLPTMCAVDEAAVGDACALADDTSVSLRILVDEPVRASLSAGGRRVATLAPRGEASLRLRNLTAGRTYPALLELTDLAGNPTSEVLELSTPADLATLSVTEVRANPAGPEPRQEYVELLNYGDVPVDLNGVALSDRPDALGDVVDQSVSLEPGERVLLVADRFDPDDPEDTPVPPGVRLVRIGTSLASGGLTNGGEALFLRDALGRRLSATPAVETDAGECVARRAGAGMRDGAADAFELRACAPGRP